MIDPGTSIVLRVMQEEGVEYLLVGGQACVIYGAAEFSKDVDFVVLADMKNFNCLRKVSSKLEAAVIAVPPFEKEYLDEGLAIHLRCGLMGVEGFRVDLMSEMRGVAPFACLWKRRTTIQAGDLEFNVMSVRDLVQSKKTQRSKDWPMIQRLVEVHYLRRKDNKPSQDDIKFWLLEMRTVEMIVEVTQRFKAEAQEQLVKRSLLQAAIDGDQDAVRKELTEETEAEREVDRLYWEPLKARLGELRREARRVNG